MEVSTKYKPKWKEITLEDTALKYESILSLFKKIYRNQVIQKNLKINIIIKNLTSWYIFNIFFVLSIIDVALLNKHTLLSIFFLHSTHCFLHLFLNIYAVLPVLFSRLSFFLKYFCLVYLDLTHIIKCKYHSSMFPLYAY